MHRETGSDKRPHRAAAPPILPSGAPGHTVAWMVRSVRSTGLVLALVALLPLARDARAETPAGYAKPCPPTGAVVAIFTRTHELYLCREGAAEERILVALGRGGVDKRRRGDGRTPLGTYAFGAPRASRRFRTFIPIDYPTPEQARQGYTGGGLGIHGPPRAWTDAVAARALDWTTGCVATGTDEEVDRVARFVREHRPLAVIR